MLFVCSGGCLSNYWNKLSKQLWPIFLFNFQINEIIIVIIKQPIKIISIFSSIQYNFLSIPTGGEHKNPRSTDPGVHSMLKKQTGKSVMAVATHQHRIRISFIWQVVHTHNKFDFGSPLLSIKTFKI